LIHTNRNLAIIADDLTGACDVGAQFAKQGFSTSVLLGSRRLETLRNASNELLVFDTETRNGSAKRAASRIRSLSFACKRAGIPLGYKKIDSTVRGNLGAELDSILNIFQRLAIVVSPAYPEYGRTVVNGTLLVNGEPIDRTEFANDPMSPVGSSNLKDLVHLQTDRSVDFIYLATVRKGPAKIAVAVRRSMRAGTRILCVDAKNRRDLWDIAHACSLVGAIPCGSAGLAGEVAAAMEVPRRRTMVVSASVNSATMSELRAVGSSIPLIKARAEALIASKDRQNEIRRIRNRVRAVLHSHNSVVVCSAVGKADLRKMWPRNRTSTSRDPIAAGLADAVSPIILDEDVRGILVTGGEMASALFARINAKELTVEAEILPGIAVCDVTSGRAAGLKVITKAGGFGMRGSMIRLVRYLEHGSGMRIE